MHVLFRQRSFTQRDRHNRTSTKSTALSTLSSDPFSNGIGEVKGILEECTPQKVWLFNLSTEVLYQNPFHPAIPAQLKSSSLRRKVKCDEQKPWCYNCRRLRLFCGQAVTLATADLELTQPESRATPAIVAECATNNIVRSIYPQPPGSAVPPGWRGLLDHYDRESVPILCSYDDQKNPMRTLYFPIAMSDEATFHALLALSAIHRARRFSSLTDQQQALKLESKALEALQSHPLLQSPETEAFSHYGTIADDRTSILTAVTVLMGTRYLDRDMCMGGGFADHVRGFWTLLRHFGIAHKLDEIPTGSLLFEAVRIGCFFTACALMEGSCDAESPVMWRECQSILARAGEIDYHAGYCYRQLGVLTEVVELERQPQLTPKLRERANRMVRNLTNGVSEGVLESDNGYHESVERAFKLGLAIRLRVSVLRVPLSSPMVSSLVHSALAEFQQHQDLGSADAFSLRALFEIGKACTDTALREFISTKFSHISWRGYGTVDLYRRQLETIWSLT